MDERPRFIARLLEGEKMSSVWREFGISRVTGYKTFNHYKDCGLDALSDRSRRPYRHANKLPYQVERSILGLKREHLSWRAPKIRDKLIHDDPMIKPPTISTVHAVLDRHDLVQRRRRRRYRAAGTTLSASDEPNGLWCADDKGELMLGNKHDGYPLTISDDRTHYLQACEGMTSTRSDFAFAVFERVFKEFGLPRAIRTDHGPPLPARMARTHMPRRRKRKPKPIPLWAS
ncbi:MAG: helix-turn-helix domain-containing protein [Geminicoccales bacterium]